MVLVRQLATEKWEVTTYKELKWNGVEQWSVPVNAVSFLIFGFFGSAVGPAADIYAGCQAAG